MDFGLVTLQLLQGFGITCLLFILTLILSLPLGLIISFGSMSKYKALKIPIKCIVWIIRGTPLMLQIFVVFYLPGIIGIPMRNRFLAVTIAFVINYAIYFSEIFRSGFENISKGQYEASRVLGLTKIQTLFKIVLPQVVKNILPPISNETMTLVKDTALANVIGVVEIIMAAQGFAAYQAIIWPLFYAGAFYLVFNGLLTLLFAFTEKKLNYYR